MPGTPGTATSTQPPPSRGWGPGSGGTLSRGPPWVGRHSDVSSPCPDCPHLGDDAPGHAEDGREAPVPGLALDDVVAVVAVAGEAERRVQQLRAELLAVVVQQRAVDAVTWKPGVTLD